MYHRTGNPLAYRYGVFLIGGCQSRRTEKDAEGTKACRRFDGIEPWSVGDWGIYFQNVVNDGITPTFVAILDEVDEGAAISQVTYMPPTPGHFVTLDGLPSDCYLRFTGEVTQPIHVTAKGRRAK